MSEQATKSRETEQTWLWQRFAVWLMLAGLGAVLGLLPLQGLTAPAENRKAAPKKAKNHASFIPGSAETTAQRNARLKRECKGGVNAGACTGHTH